MSIAISIGSSVEVVAWAIDTPLPGNTLTDSSLNSFESFPRFTIEHVRFHRTPLQSGFKPGAVHTPAWNKKHRLSLCRNGNLNQQPEPEFLDEIGSRKPGRSLHIKEVKILM